MKQTQEGDITALAKAFNANQDALHKLARIGAELAEAVLALAEEWEGDESANVPGAARIVALAREFQAKGGG